MPLLHSLHHLNLSPIRLYVFFIVLVLVEVVPPYINGSLDVPGCCSHSRLHIHIEPLLALWNQPRKIYWIVRVINEVFNINLKRFVLIRTTAIATLMRCLRVRGIHSLDCSFLFGAFLRSACHLIARIWLFSDEELSLLVEQRLCISLLHIVTGREASPEMLAGRVPNLRAFRSAWLRRLWDNIWRLIVVPKILLTESMRWRFCVGTATIRRR